MLASSDIVVIPQVSLVSVVISFLVRVWLQPMVNLSPEAKYYFYINRSYGKDICDGPAPPLLMGKILASFL